MATKMTGARLFGQILKAYGVTHLFFMDAVLRRALAEQGVSAKDRLAPAVAKSRIRKIRYCSVVTCPSSSNVQMATSTKKMSSC